MRSHGKRRNKIDVSLCRTIVGCICGVLIAAVEVQAWSSPLVAGVGGKSKCGGGASVPFLAGVLCGKSGGGRRDAGVAVVMSVNRGVIGGESGRVRVAVVTGSNRGIGKEICKQLSEQVIMTARSASKGKRAAEELGAGCEFFPCDVTDSRSIVRLKEMIEEKYGEIDCLVNNAAIGLKGESFTRASAQKLLDTNCYGPLLLSRTLLPVMREHARIVMVSSRSAQLSRFSPPLRTKLELAAATPGALQTVMDQFLTEIEEGSWREGGVAVRMWLRATGLGLYFTSGPHHTAYCVSKAGLNAGARQLASEAKANHVEVNCCCPGWVQTDMAGPLAPSSIPEGASTPVFLALPSSSSASASSSPTPEPSFWADCQQIPW